MYLDPINLHLSNDSLNVIKEDFLPSNLLHENLSANLSEAYFGKRPFCLKLENLFSNIRQQLHDISNPHTSNIYVSQMEELLKKEFNFEKVNIVIEPNMSELDAYTFPFYSITSHINKNDFKVEVTNNSIRFKNPKNKTLSVFISTYTIFNTTDAQCVAILLHEIGHNFFIVDEHYKLCKNTGNIFQGYCYIIRAIETFKKLEYETPDKKMNLIINLIFNGIILIVTVFFKEEYVKKMIEMMRTDLAYILNFGFIDYNKFNPLIKKIISLSLASWEFYAKIVHFKFIAVWFPMLIISLAPAFVFSKIIRYQFKDLDYANERFADNFATTYGYGNELAFVMSNKFIYRDADLLQKFGKDIPIIGLLNAYHMSLMTALFTFVDPHPAYKFRGDDQLKKLKWELQNNSKYLTKNQLDNLKKDIANLEKTVKMNDEFVTDRLLYNVLKIDKINDKIALGLSNIKDEDLYDFNKLLKDYIV